MKVKDVKENKKYSRIDGVKIPVEEVLDKDSPSRSIAKSISWRIVASLTTFTIFYFTVGSKVAVEVITAAVGIEAVSKMFIYFIHERIWANIYWGKNWMKNKLIRRIKLKYIRINRKYRKEH